MADSAGEDAAFVEQEALRFLLPSNFTVDESGYRATIPEPNEVGAGGEAAQEASYESLGLVKLLLNAAEKMPPPAAPAPAAKDSGEGGDAAQEDDTDSKRKRKKKAPPAVRTLGALKYIANWQPEKRLKVHAAWNRYQRDLARAEEKERKRQEAILEEEAKLCTFKPKIHSKDAVGSTGEDRDFYAAGRKWDDQKKRKLQEKAKKAAAEEAEAEAETYTKFTVSSRTEKLAKNVDRMSLNAKDLRHNRRVGHGGSSTTPRRARTPQKATSSQPRAAPEMYSSGGGDDPYGGGMPVFAGSNQISSANDPLAALLDDLDLPPSAYGSGASSTPRHTSRSHSSIGGRPSYRKQVFTEPTDPVLRHSFAPVIDGNSQRLADAINQGDSFLDRMDEDINYRDERQEQWATPVVDALKLPDDAIQAAADRLHNPSPRSSTYRRTVTQESGGGGLTPECTFTPRINEYRPDPDTPVPTMSREERHQRLHAHRIEEFSPKPSKLPESEIDDFIHRSEQWLADKAVERQELEAARDAIKMEECTFKPRINEYELSTASWAVDRSVGTQRSAQRLAKVQQRVAEQQEESRNKRKVSPWYPSDRFMDDSRRLPERAAEDESAASAGEDPQLCQNELRQWFASLEASSGTTGWIPSKTAIAALKELAALSSRGFSFGIDGEVSHRVSFADFVFLYDRLERQT